MSLPPIKYSGNRYVSTFVATENPTTKTVNKDHYILPTLHPKGYAGSRDVSILDTTENQVQETNMDSYILPSLFPKPDLPPALHNPFPDKSVFHDTSYSTTVKSWGGRDMQNCRMSGVDLHEANLFMTILKGSVMDGANMEGVCAYRADMSYSSMLEVDCRNADFVCADLKNTVMCGSRLFGASFRHADLRGTNLTGCCLGSTDLTGAVINQKTLFDKVTYDQYTIIPESARLPLSARFVTAITPPEWWTRVLSH
ncbi:TPA: pentapeptide repeat-containing protein [Yersinia enterocolitica]|nr:pentapeptide repeat-containing protein [Yersinia enterocolitica]HDL6985323.1 pentapeptide repeat-containing protein [Yersinia enterocolitica]HDL7067863.1 pentapeptide repeat-containing protein [Yersinia enterocolitica]HDL7072254.1 pentapeptide repeat-containing protein [Yersinia enterocolitica]